MAGLSLIKTKSGDGYKHIYYVVDTFKKKVIYKKSTGKEKLSEAKKDLLAYELKKATSVKLKKETTFADFVELFKAHKFKKLCTKSIKGYEAAISNFTKYIDKKHPTFYIHNFENDHLDIFFGKLENENPWTAFNTRKYLNTIFEQARIWKYIPVNPVADSSQIKIDKKPPKTYTKEEFIRLLNAIDNYEFPKDTPKRYATPECKRNYKEAYLISVFTGVRFNELQKLPPFNYPDGELCIDMTKKLLRIYMSKTKKWKVIEMHDEIIPIIERLQAECIVTGRKTLFAGNRDGNPINNGLLWRKLKMFNKIAGNRAELDLKALRATFGSWVYEATGDIYLASKQLGHSTVKTTESHYVSGATTVNTGRVNSVKLYESNMTIAPAV